MPRVFTAILMIIFLVCNVSNVAAKLTLKEVRTSSNNVLVAYFTSDKIDVNEANTGNLSDWIINGKPVKNIYKYAVQADPCDHHIYLETAKLVKGNTYNLQTPYGNKKFTFNPKNILCESIKVNQAGYSSLSKTRYANFAIWLGTGGSRKIEGNLPKYDVIDQSSGRLITKGKLKEIGKDPSSGDFVLSNYSFLFFLLVPNQFIVDIEIQFTEYLSNIRTTFTLHIFLINTISDSLCKVCSAQTIFYE